ncbi:glycosyl hydrolase family 28-related protein [Nocardioides sp. NPDC127503]|uniref:glycosyl hydrolase family 28-related protein n=1 Tax=Nocardioides sp. NPDC127503 TaxID=3154516 RepID=UPI00332769D3
MPHLDRRNLLALSGLAAGAALVPATAAQAATRGSTAMSTSGGAALWQEYLAAPDTHPQIPNVSYAGYGRGDRSIPRPRVVANVMQCGARGDGRADDTDALRRAVMAAGAAGGGVVLLPPGTYRTTGMIPVHDSGVVIRGESPEETVIYCENSLDDGYMLNRRGWMSQWSWMGGQIWFVPRRRLASLREAGFVGNEAWMDNETLTTLAPAARGDRELRVTDATGLRAGDTVLLTLRNLPDNSLLKHLCGDISGADDYDWETKARRLRPEISDWTGAPNFEHYRWPVQVTAVYDGRITLAQPLRVELRPEWEPTLTTLGPVIRNAGIESLTMRMREIPTPQHSVEPGFNGPCFQSAIDCWARDVHVEHADNAFGLVGTKNVSILGARVSGRRGHHPFMCRVQSHDNLVADFEIAGPTQHGLNVEGLSSGNVWAGGTMAHGTLDSHKLIPTDAVRTAIRVNNDGNTGGAGDAGPNWGARFTHWNIEVTNGRSHGIRIEENSPHSAVVGVTGTTEPTNHARDFSGPLGSVTESLDATVLPKNLYLAQLRHRRRTEG